MRGRGERFDESNDRVSEVLSGQTRLADRANQRGTHDRTFRVPNDRGDVIRGCDAETRGKRKIGALPNEPDPVFELRRITAFTGDPPPSEQVEEFAGRRRDSPRTRWRGVRREQRAETDVRRFRRLGERFDGVEIRVGNDHTVESRRRHRLDETGTAHAIDDRDAHHREQRKPDRISTGSNLRQDRIDSSAAFEGRVHGRRDQGTIRDRITEGDSDLDGVCARLLQRLKQDGEILDPGITGDDERHQRTGSCSSMSCEHFGEASHGEASYPSRSTDQGAHDRFSDHPPAHPTRLRPGVMLCMHRSADRTDTSDMLVRVANLSRSLSMWVVLIPVLTIGMFVGVGRMAEARAQSDMIGRHWRSVASIWGHPDCTARSVRLGTRENATRSDRRDGDLVIPHLELVLESPAPASGPLADNAHRHFIWSDDATVDRYTRRVTLGDLRDVRMETRIAVDRSRPVRIVRTDANGRVVDIRSVRPVFVMAEP